MAGTCKRSNESLGSIKCGEFLDYVKTSQLLKDSALWSKLISNPSPTHFLTSIFTILHL